MSPIEAYLLGILMAIIGGPALIAWWLFIWSRCSPPLLPPNSGTTSR